MTGPALTVDALKTARAELERDLREAIAARVARFTRETGVDATSISVDTHQFVPLGARPTLCVLAVRVDLDLR